jgi:hypothetical protein
MAEHNANMDAKKAEMGFRKNTSMPAKKINATEKIVKIFFVFLDLADRYHDLLMRNCRTGIPGHHRDFQFRISGIAFMFSFSFLIYPSVSSRTSLI